MSWYLFCMLDRLVFCTCGHALNSHDSGSCVGDRGKPCSCNLGRAAALESAVSLILSKHKALEVES